MASTVTTEPVSASEPSKVWTAGISLDFSLQSRCASTRAVSEAKALSMCAARRARELARAAAEGRAIDRHTTLTFAVRRVVQHGGMAAECSLDRRAIELSQDTTDRRVSWSFPPLHAERIAQPGEVNIDEAVDCPIRVGAGDNCQDRKQYDVWQAI